MDTRPQDLRQQVTEEQLARWCRSLAVAPGPDLDRLLKAQGSTADIVLYDLEDGVYPAFKDDARRAFQSLPTELLRRPLGLRINSPRTDDGMADLRMLATATTAPVVVVLPKVESARDVELADDLLSGFGSRAWLWAIVESGTGIVRVHEIAQSSTRLAALSFGSADFCAEMGISMKWEPLLHARSQLVLAARTAGLGALDSPTFALDDPDLLTVEAAAAAELGFTGKIAVHPQQIDVINAAFTPTVEQIDWARSVVGALTGQRNSISKVRGQMVGPPFLRAAQRILTQARQATA